MKVIDDFLSSYQFKFLESVMMSDNFPWFYNDKLVKAGDRKYGFVHTFFDKRPPWNGETNNFSLLGVILSQLRVRNLERIKANLNTKTLFHQKGGWHIDGFDCNTTAIFYLNTNNGWTEFKKGGRVESVANRIVIFDSHLEHTGVTCTKEQRRVMINFNYDI